MSTQLESWKYFDQQDVKSDEAGEMTLGTLAGSVDETKPSFSMPLMVATWLMGGLGFSGVIAALYELRSVFNAGALVEATRGMNPRGMEAVGYAVNEAHSESIMLVLTLVILKIFVSCGFMGAAVMLEKRVDYGNWFAGLICFAAILYSPISVGLRYLMLPDYTKYGISAAQSQSLLEGSMLMMAVACFIKIAIFIGLVVFLNSKANTEIFKPRERKSLA